MRRRCRPLGIGPLRLEDHQYFRQQLRQPPAWDSSSLEYLLGNAHVRHVRPSFTRRYWEALETPERALLAPLPLRTTQQRVDRSQSEVTGGNRTPTLSWLSRVQRCVD